MFPTRMCSEKPEYEVLQDAFIEKEGPDRNKEGWKCNNDKLSSNLVLYIFNLYSIFLTVQISSCSVACNIQLNLILVL